MQAIRRHLSYANVIATVALFLALGGTAWALSKNSVGTKQLKNNAVTAKKIKNHAVTGAKIANGAISGPNLNISVFQQAATAITSTGGSNDVGGATATCPSGKKAIAGGGLSDPSTNGGFIEDSRPVNGTTDGPAQGGTFTGWRVIWNNWGNLSGVAIHPVVYVVCLG